MTAPPTVEVLRARIDRLWDVVAGAGGSPETVTLVAVTKGFGPEMAVRAAQVGLVDLGENYAQELTAKAPVVAEAGFGARWHMIGRLQRNKVRVLAQVTHLWQTVDRFELAAEIARHAPAARVLVQVNTSGEPNKGGVDPSEAETLVTQSTELGLRVEGLMAVGRTGTPEGARAGFARLSALADQLCLPTRSMGMSADVEVAVQEGSTMIRVGSGLFGPRPAGGTGPATSRPPG